MSTKQGIENRKVKRDQNRARKASSPELVRKRAAAQEREKDRQAK